MQRPALKWQGHFHLDKAKFYIIEEDNLINNIEIYHITVTFSPEKKKKKRNNLSLKDWSLSFYSAVSRILWKQILQHLSKLLWLAETESCGAREALLLLQATADKRQCLQGHHLHVISSSTFRSPTTSVPHLINVVILTGALFMFRKSSLFFSGLLFSALTL